MGKLWTFGRSWRQVVRNKAQLWPLFWLWLIAIAHFVGWLVAATVFTSQVTRSTGNLIRIASAQPGYIIDGSSPEQFLAAAKYNRLNLNTAQATARACYNASSDSTNTLCAQYLTPSVSYTTNKNATCPFDESVCLLNNQSSGQAISFNTGMMDSAEVFGIAAKEQDRILYEKQVVCAPLGSIPSQDLETINGTRQIHYFAGEVNMGTVSKPQWQDYTFAYQTGNWNETSGYQVSSYTAYTENVANTYIPIPQLNRTDADITIIFLTQNQMEYLNPVEDPIFKATLSEESSFYGTVYISNYLVNVIGCLDQHRFCNPSNNKCTPLSGFLPMTRAINSSELDLSPNQLSAAWRILNPEASNNVQGIVDIAGPDSLQASLSVIHGDRSVGLPPNQWQIEAEGWFQTALVNLQNQIIIFARKDFSVDFGVLASNITGYLEYMATHQVVHGDINYTTFSCLGLFLILSISLIFLITSFYIDNIIFAIYSSRCFGQNRVGIHHKQRQYWADGNFQLLRLAYEASGHGTWIKDTSQVPVTVKDEQLALLRESAPGSYKFTFSSQTEMKPFEGLGYKNEQASGSSIGPIYEDTYANKDMPRITASELASQPLSKRPTNLVHQESDAFDIESRPRTISLPPATFAAKYFSHSPPYHLVDSDFPEDEPILRGEATKAAEQRSTSTMPQKQRPVSKRSYNQSEYPSKSNLFKVFRPGYSPDQEYFTIPTSSNDAHELPSTLANLSPSDPTIDANSQSLLNTTERNPPKLRAPLTNLTRLPSLQFSPLEARSSQLMPSDDTPPPPPPPKDPMPYRSQPRP